MVTICSCARKILPSKLSWLRKPPVRVLVACDPKGFVHHRHIDPNLGNNGHLERSRETQITLANWMIFELCLVCVCLSSSVCPLLCLSVCLSASVCLSVCLSGNTATYAAPVSLETYPLYSFCLSICLFVRPAPYPCVLPSISSVLSACLSPCLSAPIEGLITYLSDLSVYLFICSSVCLPLLRKD